MRKSVFLLFLLVSSEATACPLEGVWKSDKSKSLSELYGSNLPNSVKMKLGKLFGKLKVEYHDCSHSTATFEGDIYEHHFEVVHSKGSEIVLLDVETSETTTLTLNGDCYSVPVQRLGINEHFCRIQ